MRECVCRIVFTFSVLMLLSFGEGLAEKVFIALLFVAATIAGIEGNK